MFNPSTDRDFVKNGALLGRVALVIVKPATVIAWHRRGFGWYWTWKIRHGRTGRPSISKETRDLIRSMSRDNPLWERLEFTAKC